jgi:MarR family transcriptional regulator, lower aerobic nicotinate degradation pathway regulator
MPQPTFRELPTWLLSQAAVRSHRILHARLAGVGASGYEYRVLSALDAASTATQAELGRLTGLDRRDVAVTVQALEKAALLTRSRSPDDARVLVVKPTSAGRRRSRELDRVAHDVQEEVFGPLTASDRRQLVRSLAQLSGS